MKSPDLAPPRPARWPATERSWHGDPPQMISTGGSFPPSSLVISPTWVIYGNRSFVTSTGNASISLAHTGTMPVCTAARGNPPMPSNRLPMVSIFSSVTFPSKQKSPTVKISISQWGYPICIFQINFLIFSTSYYITPSMAISKASAFSTVRFNR